MSEPKKTQNQEPEQEDEKVEKKPASKKPAKKDEPEKEKVKTRVKKWWDRNKKAVGAFALGAGTGAAGAVTYGVVRNRIKRKKAEEVRYIPEQEPEYGSPLDPNV